MLHIIHKNRYIHRPLFYGRQNNVTDPVWEASLGFEVNGEMVLNSHKTVRIFLMYLISYIKCLNYQKKNS